MRWMDLLPQMESREATGDVVRDGTMRSTAASVVFGAADVVG